MKGSKGYTKLQKSDQEDTQTEPSAQTASSSLVSPVQQETTEGESHPLQPVFEVTVAGEDSEEEEEDNEPLSDTLRRVTARGSSNAQYEPVATQTSSTSTTTRPTVGIQANDGVFFNISAKPDLYDDKPPDEPLPSYQEVVGEQAPPYFDPTVIAVGGDTGEILIEGLPVGGAFTFALNMLVSTVFQLVGFLLTYLLHGSHAAKDGSFVGLGITFLHFGFYIRSRASHGSAYPPDADQQAHTGVTNGVHNIYLSYILMVIGWFIVLRSVADFIRVKRLERAIMTSPEGVV
ncbi:hypothetical protein IWQ61_002461 [Dispira simplex]|nr:hypothetical protein IWQ61_002461 [Dispira simplex]